MLAKTQHKKIHLQPRSFADLMEMYEVNYIRLRLICGDIRRLTDGLIVNDETDLVITLDVLEQTRHTSTLTLNYRFENTDEEKRPNCIIRVYHDSRQVEVLSKQCRLTGTSRRSNDSTLPLDEMLMCRWKLNRFLYKWLGYMRYQKRYFVTDK